MKKMTAMILALVMILVLGCTAMAESAETPEINMNNWLLKSLTDTDWIQKEGRASLDIVPIMDETATEQFKVILHWPDSAEEAVEWDYYGTLNRETRSLSLVEEYCYDVKYGEDGDVELSTERYSRACDVTLAWGEDGLLTLSGSEEEQIALIGFEPVPAAQAKVSPVTDEQAALFAKATEKLLGVGYEPVGLIDEADDLYFCFLCTGTVVYPGATPVYYLAVLNNTGLEGPAVEFIQIVDDGQ